MKYKAQSSKVEGDSRLQVPTAVASPRRRFRCSLLAAWGFFAMWNAGFGALPLPDLDWKSAGGHRYAELPVAGKGKTGFTQMSADKTGIRFMNLLGAERGITNQIYLSGSGVAAGDVDGDGWCDLYFCGLDSPNALYRNLGNWKFVDIAAAAGVACADQASTGAVLADVDGDGDLDLLVTGIGRGVRLFLNDGKGHFHEATAPAGLAGHTGSMSLALADVDGNGTLDLYVANYRSSTFQDLPNTRFRVVTHNGRPAIASVNGVPTTEPDLTNRYSVDPATLTVYEHGEADVLYRNDGRGHFTPVSWTDGSFLDEDGRPVQTPYDWGYSVLMRDLNGDGAPDIYVCNDADSPDRIWINNGAGRFQAAPRLALRHTSFSSMGVDVADLDRDGRDDIFVSDMLMREHPLRHTQLVTRRPLLGPGEVDQRPQYPHNTLFWNQGDGGYVEMAQLSGVAASDWTWSPVFLDVDLDGYEDLLITTGLDRNYLDADARALMEAAKRDKSVSRPQFYELRKRFGRLENPNFAFRNRGDLTFENVSANWGFDSRQVSHGIALADLDNDGDLDVVVNCLNAPPLVYRNETAAPRLAVRLKGLPPNTRGIGAKLKLLGGPVMQSQEMICGGRYLSGDDPLRVFAAGSPTNGMSLEVTWRNGTVSIVKDVRPNRLYEIEEEKSVVRSQLSVASGPVEPARTAGPRPSTLDPRPFFKDVSRLLHHTHVADGFDDFQRQPLLSRRLSRPGPGVAWADLNGDGREDLLIGGGRGGELAIFFGDRQGGFRRIATAGFTGKRRGDLTTVIAWPSAPGSATVLAGVSNYETGDGSEPSVRRWEIWAGAIDAGESLPGSESSVGPMALADIDGDGDLDLLVGGRVIGGRYPEAASSRLYRSEGGKFVLDEENSRTLERVGLVSGAAFSDLNGDGLPELVVACEWGPLKIYRNDNGKLVPWNPPVVAEVERRGSSVEGLGQALDVRPATLDQLTGWWNSVAAGDFDGDGHMDLVAGNWGRNTKYQRFLEQPLRVFYGNLVGDDAVECLEAYTDPSLKEIVPWAHWDMLSRFLPFVAERYPNFHAYGTAGLAAIMGERMKEMKELRAITLDTMMFLNRGDHFEAVALPRSAQLAPVFGIAVGDFDGDGTEDVFLSQNFFGVDGETSRYDAGRGSWLRGDGRGKFNPVSTRESGIKIYGEGRGAALCDYDGDGRVDLAVAQNAAETKLYHNEQARPGLRVRLSGPPGNPTGVGAVIRLIYGPRPGPAREIHAGSGYWSQDSAVQVMAAQESPTQVQVRWPGGKVTTADVATGAGEIALDSAGRLKMLR